MNKNSNLEKSKYLLIFSSIYMIDLKHPYKYISLKQ